MFPPRAILPIGTALVLTSATVRANTWYVDASAAPPGIGTQASPYTSIQFAHDQATTIDFDTVLVAPGTYVENVTLSKRITVSSTGGALVTTLLPAQSGTILTLNGNGDDSNIVTFDGFHIRGLFGPSGTAAVASVDGTLRRCIVSGTPGAGHAGFLTQYDASIVDCTIAGNDVGIVQSNQGLTYVANTILWNKVTDFEVGGGMNPFIQHCATGNSPVGNGQTGNFQGDPGLCYPWTGDMHLLAGSPCVDAGHPALPNDPDGSPGDIGCLAFDAQYACGPFTDFCPGDGQGAACPCGNQGLHGRGCDNSSSFVGGALLYAEGSPNPDTVVLHVFGVRSTALTIFFQGNATLAPGVPFGDGLRCAGGLFKRLYVKTAVGGEANAPTGGDPTITTRSAAVGDPIPSGGLRYYQTYYRDGTPSFCPSPQGNTFNASSGVKVIW